MAERERREVEFDGALGSELAASVEERTAVSMVSDVRFINECKAVRILPEMGMFLRVSDLSVRGRVRMIDRRRRHFFKGNNCIVLHT